MSQLQEIRVPGCSAEHQNRLYIPKLINRSLLIGWFFPPKVMNPQTQGHPPIHKQGVDFHGVNINQSDLAVAQNTGTKMEPW